VSTEIISGAVEPPAYDFIDEVDTAGLKVAVVRAALELDVFTLVATGSTTDRALAHAAGCSERGMTMLVRALLSLGLLELDGTTLRCSRTAAAYLSADSPGCSAPIYRTWFQNRDHLVETIRSGRAHGDHAEHDGASDWQAYGSPDLVRWPVRAATIPRNLGVQGVHAAPGARILDLGCGSGMIGFALVLANDEATVVSVDRPGVLSVADQLATAMNVRSRCSLVGGDVASVDLADGSFDIALLVNVAQYLDDDRLLATLTSVRAALVEGGQLYLSTVVVDEGTLENPMNWNSAVEMYLASSVDQRTAEQVLALLSAAGFDDVARPTINAFVASACSAQPDNSAMIAAVTR